VITGDDFGVSLHAENGDLLTSFSGDGKQRVNTSYHDIATSVTFDTQGNVLVAGSTFIENQDRMTVVRLKPNGDLDPAFGQGGIARVKFPGVKQSVAYGVTRDSWNRVVLAGFAYTNAGVFHIAVARLKADGKLDETFSQDGMVMKLCPGASSAMARAVTLDPTASPTSNISVTGQAIYGGLIQVSLARFTHTGELDPYFGADSNGCVHTSFPPDLSAGNAIGVTAFGKSVVAGFTLTQ
jgi:uncharacterized delta-60 repeat protein